MFMRLCGVAGVVRTVCPICSKASNSLEHLLHCAIFHIDRIMSMHSIMRTRGSITLHDEPNKDQPASQERVLQDVADDEERAPLAKINTIR